MMRTVRVSAAVTVLAGAVALAVVVAPSMATVEELDGVIAYPIGGGEDPYVIRTVNADGTNDRRLIGPRRKLFFLDRPALNGRPTARSCCLVGIPPSIRRPDRCGTRRPLASESRKSLSVSAAVVAVPARSSSMAGTGLRTASASSSPRARVSRVRGCTRSRLMEGTAEHCVAAGGRSGPATAGTSCSASSPRTVGAVPGANRRRQTERQRFPHAHRLHS